MYQATPGISPLDGAIVENGDKAQHNIAKDKFVNHKGILKQAASAISVGDNLTSTNLIDYTTGNDGKKGIINELSDQIATLNNNLTSLSDQILKGNKYADSVDMSSYTSTKYTAPTDGYFHLVNGSGQTGMGFVYFSDTDSYNVNIGGVAGRFGIYVKKGMRIIVSGTFTAAVFYKLKA